MPDIQQRRLGIGHSTIRPIIISGVKLSTNDILRSSIYHIMCLFHFIYPSDNKTFFIQWQWRIFAFRRRWISIRNDATIYSKEVDRTRSRKFQCYVAMSSPHH